MRAIWLRIMLHLWQQGCLPRRLERQGGRWIWRKDAPADGA